MSWEKLLVALTHVIIVVKFWSLQMPTTFPLVGAAEGKSGNQSWLEEVFNKLILALAGRELYDRSLRITADLLKLIDDCTLADNCHFGRLDLLKGWAVHLFESWRHYEWNFRGSCYGDDDWSSVNFVDRKSWDCGLTVQGLRIWIGGDWASRPSINIERSVRENHFSSSSKNSYFKTLVFFLLRRHVVLYSFHQMEEGEREGGRRGDGDQALFWGIWKVRHISHREGAVMTY